MSKSINFNNIISLCNIRCCRPWQIKFWVMYVDVHMFYIIFSLMYFHIRTIVRVKQKISFLHSSWKQTIWQLSWLNDFSIDAIANIFVYERLKIPDAHSEPRGTSNMGFFAKMVSGKKSLTISTKSSFLDVWMRSEYVSVSASFFPGTLYTLLGKEVSREKNMRESRN